MADWIDLLRSAPRPDEVGLAFTDGAATGMAMRQAQVAEGERRRAFADQQQYRSRVAEMIRTGDLRGAAAQAAAYGDDKASTNFITLQKNQYDQGAAGAGAMSEVVRGIAALPYEQRRAAIAAAKPSLRAMGYADADIDGFDPSDQNLAAVAGLGYSAHDRATDTTSGYEARTKRMEAEQPVVVGGSLVTRGGQELYRAPDYINAPLGNNVYEVPGTTSDGYVGGAVGADQVWNNMIGAESGGQHFNANGQPLTSPKGAVGIAQVMPATGPEAARDAGLPWDERRYHTDPEYNKAIGRGYYNKLLRHYGGDPEKAAAAYNAGPQRVDRALSRGGQNWRQYLPAETRGYIGKVIGQRSTTRQVRQIQQGQYSPSEVAKQQQAQTGKPIPQGQTKSYESEVKQYQALDHAMNSFDDNYGSNVAGGLENWAQSYAGWVGTPGQRDWWANFRSTDNLIRNGLFGSALTEHEKKAYDATTISPGMDSGEIRRNLTRRREIVREALARRQKFLAAQGYSRDAIVDLAGEDIGGIGRGNGSGSGGNLRVPKSHVDALRSGRVSRDQFDERYGRGAADRVLAR